MIPVYQNMLHYFQVTYIGDKEVLGHREILLVGGILKIRDNLVVARYILIFCYSSGCLTKKSPATFSLIVSPFFNQLSFPQILYSNFSRRAPFLLILKHLSYSNLVYFQPFHSGLKNITHVIIIFDFFLFCSLRW